MARVYLARDLRYDKFVAIKKLNPELSAALGPERFLREIDIVAHLNHPHILPLLDSGEDRESLYYVMPYIAGESLRHRLRRETQLPIGDAIAIARDVARALDYAHRQGVVHRDIKPENILMSEGLAIVADFGIARAISLAAEDDRITQSGLSPGTPPYMSPEQASGEDVDGRSDVYALGCVLYELLAGQPPFTGPSTQAILARHLADPVPPLRTVRKPVSPGLERVVMKALEKVPADRFSTGAEFAAALDAARTGRTDRRRLVARIGLVTAMVISAGVVWRLFAQAGVSLDRNKVVVFPLAEAIAPSQREAAGYEVALMIESGLERTEPLSWIDGWSELDPDQRGNVALVTARTERRIARERGARWTIGGAVVRRSDSATVVLRINDVAGDSLVRQTSVTRPAAQVAQAGLEAINILLPAILAPGRRFDLTALAERRPAAVASWLQGEREYRLGNFDTALVYLRRSVDEDSALAVAALRAAQAASWKGLLVDASKFADLALTHLSLLPVRQAAFARGLAAYLRGAADSAVRWLNVALAVDPNWTEAHMTLGEVYHHLLPRVSGPLDSLAVVEFRAAALDTGFAPPLFHLAEIAIRTEDANQAGRAVERFERFGGGTQERRELALMLACAQRGSAMDWKAAVGLSAFEALSAAKMLSIAGAFPECVEDAARTILATSTAADYHWGATMLLQDMLAAQGRLPIIITLVDSLRATGFWQPAIFYVIDALAGTPGCDTEVNQTIRSLRSAYGSRYEDSLSDNSLLLLGTWYARSSRIADAERLQHLLTGHTKARGPAGLLGAAALAGHILLAKGDSAGALSRFEQLTPSSTLDDLQWGYTDALPVERQTLAALLFARRQYQSAIDVSAKFDHPSPTVYLPFLPASLALRYRAALALARPEEAQWYRRRLQALGRVDLLNSTT